mgnify:FL=1
MNSQKIKQIFPDHAMVFIKSDLRLSLQREWALHGHQRYVARCKQNTVCKLEHYQAFRAPNWPNIDTEDQIDQLPDEIKQQVQADYDQVVASVDHNTLDTDIVARLTRDATDKINSAYEAITWHLEYYKKYPVDFSTAHHVIDIDTEANEFCKLMQNELNRYHSELFTQVWSTIHDQ